METPGALCRTMSIGGATFDLFVRTGSSLIHSCNDGRSFALPLGSKIMADSVLGTFGGGANNTSVGLSRLGCSASFSGVVGDDQWGKLILENLRKENVSVDHATVVENEQSSFAVILSAPSGERSILAYKGVDRHFHDVTFDRDAARNMDSVYLNHIHSDSCVIEDDLIAIFAAFPNLHLTWNPGGSHINKGMNEKNNRALLAHADLLLLNKEEALEFTGQTSIEDALRALLNAGARIPVITDGEKGSHATDGTSLYSCPAVPCDVVDMTGAGDAFGTAMTWAILTGKDLPNALRAGSINAMSVVGAMGAQQGLLTETEITKKIEQISLEIAVRPM